MNKAALALAFALFIPTAARADIIIQDSGRGWIGNLAGANGNTAPNNYIAGSELNEGEFRNHFDFSIPTLSGSLTSATLTLDNPLKDPLSVTNTYSVYSLGAYGTYGFSDIGSGTLYGSVEIGFPGTATVTLDSAALAALAAAQGGTFSVGGIDSGENSTNNFDFGDTGPNDASTLVFLTLETGPATPEPSAFVLLGSAAAVGLAGGWRLRRG
jgi:hypothetical protein